MRPVNDADIALYIHTARQIGTLLVTLAAEQVTPEQVRRLSDGGVIVSIGHSDTTAEEAFRRFDAGARSVTHLYNAMSQIGRSRAGSCRCGARSSRYLVRYRCGWASCRSDGAAAGAACQARRCASVPRDGRHGACRIGCGKLRDKQGAAFAVCRAASAPSWSCRMALIAGSDLDMASAVRFAVAELELTLAEALRMASLYPARYLRLNDRGRFRPGMRMDAVHLDDGLFANPHGFPAKSRLQAEGAMTGNHGPLFQ